MIFLDHSSSLPLYKQIYTEIKDSIINGDLVEDEPLPSIRALEKELNVSRNTVDRAYRQLVAEGYARSSQGKRFFVGSLAGMLFSSLFIDLFAFLANHRFHLGDVELLLCLLGDQDARGPGRQERRLLPVFGKERCRLVPGIPLPRIGTAVPAVPLLRGIRLRLPYTAGNGRPVTAVAGRVPGGWRGRGVTAFCTLLHTGVFLLFLHPLPFRLRA